MATTRPTTEQLRFTSAKTGEHSLDTYLEDAELGNRQLSALVGDLFNSSGVMRADQWEFKFDTSASKLQVRVGGSSASYSDITSFFKQRGTFSSSNTYQNFDMVVSAAKDTYIVSGLSAGSTFADEAAFIASANTTKIVDTSEARDWAIKVDGAVESTDHSAKAWAIGGTGVTDTAAKGAAKEWATETSGTVDGTSFSAKEYSQGTQASTGGSSKSWAQDADQVNGATTNDRSAKAWAQGASMTGATLGGSSKDWAQTTGGTVDGTDYSSKEYAIGTTVAAGSSKEWATTAEDSAVSGGEFSAKHYSAKSSASATASASSATASASSATTASGHSTTASGHKDTATTQAGIATTKASEASTSASAASTSAASAASAKTAAEAARDSALASLDSFDDRYLGEKSSNPSVDNDGNALVGGALYFNGTTDKMMVWTGSAWVETYADGSSFLQLAGGTMTGAINMNSQDITNADSVAATTVELGHATDTTLARSSAGVVTIEGAEVRTGTVAVNKGGTGSTSAGAARTALGVDAAGTDNSTNVTLAGTPDYITISGQAITRNAIDLTADVSGALPVANGGTASTSASAARSALGVDAAGTDNSTNVTLAGSLDYLTLSGQAITRNAIDLTTDVSGALPIANGGSGATSASAARTAYGLAIGSNVQAHNSKLDDLAAIGVTDSTFYVGNGSTIVAENAATARTSLGLGTAATQASTAFEAADTDILKADTADELTAGFSSATADAGTKSSGTFTPDPDSGNFQHFINGGAHTLAPPAKNCTMVLLQKNNASAGAITTSGFTKVDGDSLTTTNNHDFFLYITRYSDGSTTFSALTVKALQ